MALGTHGDPVEAVARVATARRDRLLRIHRRRLRWEDLEDCYSQATLELVARAQRDPFASQQHILNALEQKFSSRIDDRRRAIGGRSPIEMALARALPVDAPEVGPGDLEDRGAEVETRVVERLEVGRLREVAAELTDDQRLVLACQVSLGMDCGEFCRRFGWSTEKFRKVAQRARARLRALVVEYEVGERCQRLEPDLLAYVAGTGTEEQTLRAAEHVANCTGCASRMRALDRATRQVAALLPAPVMATAGVLAKFVGGFALVGRRWLTIVGRGPTEVGAAGVAGGSAVGAGAVKLGVAAACLAGAAGGYAICSHGLGLPDATGHAHARPKVAHVARHAAAVAPSRPISTQTAAPPSRSATTPVTGAAASAQAHREFGTAIARTASAAGAPSPPSTGQTTATQRSVAAAEFSPPASRTDRSASTNTGSERRDATQARVEFSSFER